MLLENLEFLTKPSGQSSEEKPLCVDLYCGLGGWSEGFLAEGYRCNGYDIEKHDYGTGGYPGTLHLRDILTIHGSEFKDATIIVGSSPCQKYSYMAMPWTKAKDMGRFYADKSHPERLADLNALFDAQFRIQREASEAAGHWIPMIVENVRGAQKWVGKAAANYGSFYLWGDVGMVGNRVVCVVDGRIIGGAGVMPIKASKVPGFRFDGNGGSFQTASVKTTKNDGGSWFNVAHNTTSGKGNNPVSGRKVPGISFSGYGEPGYKAVSFNSTAVRRMKSEGVKGSEGYERHHPKAFGWKTPNTTSKGAARKMASAMIAKIPFPLSQHIARTFKPRVEAVA